ncbi:Uncharacterised protein [Legionella steigerwaltii]|uniref:Uncharacterized protein n=1 Tax=Legionella steigerwaltii TaxID=460 RepID=A0A378LFK4_9GAMM|nr:hypothetical protein [Legionella steigerwaltii]KTD79497.1 hypothetical protein Lstg_0713 [Legionella steigerwaltii]STY24618.1 Uncharacterised protein [Legionella steigerwaltii]
MFKTSTEAGRKLQSEALDFAEKTHLLSTFNKNGFETITPADYSKVMSTELKTLAEYYERFAAQLLESKGATPKDEIDKDANRTLDAYNSLVERIKGNGILRHGDKTKLIDQESHVIQKAAKNHYAYHHPKYAQIDRFMDMKIDALDKVSLSKLKLPTNIKNIWEMINLLANSSKESCKDLCAYMHELTWNKTEDISSEQLTELQKRFESAIEESAKKQFGATSSKMMGIIHTAYNQLSKEPLALRLSEEHIKLMERHSPIADFKARFQTFIPKFGSKDEVDSPEPKM